MKKQNPFENTKNNLKNTKSIQPVIMTTQLEDNFTEQDLIAETDSIKPDIEMKSPHSTQKMCTSSLKTKLTSRKLLNYDFEQPQSQSSVMLNQSMSIELPEIDEIAAIQQSTQKKKR